MGRSTYSFSMENRKYKIIWELLVLHRQPVGKQLEPFNLIGQRLLIVMKKWLTYRLSWLGRIAALKMTILPVFVLPLYTQWALKQIQSVFLKLFGAIRNLRELCKHHVWFLSSWHLPTLNPPIPFLPH